MESHKVYQYIMMVDISIVKIWLRSVIEFKAGL